ncbi:hypothetical protein IGB42_00251 [Andreprevotia sp. IGB-42]|uniref:hypothetical protein n=1 Tax=Andreprevotia sp. IGB-42 TaxID=2497473 RepID=UPI001358115F|nr:hypothetical protein [Andreprevotia sp. IGB-42]KAF0815174.1 hypothetical protein IGB42_00251 [Andreprevotia sp. IGB-42]
MTAAAKTVFGLDPALLGQEGVQRVSVMVDRTRDDETRVEIRVKRAELEATTSFFTDKVGRDDDAWPSELLARIALAQFNTGADYQPAEPVLTEQEPGRVELDIALPPVEFALRSEDGAAKR